MLFRDHIEFYSNKHDCTFSPPRFTFHTLSLSQSPPHYVKMMRIHARSYLKNVSVPAERGLGRLFEVSVSILKDLSKCLRLRWRCEYVYKSVRVFSFSCSSLCGDFSAWLPGATAPFIGAALILRILYQA